MTLAKLVEEAVVADFRHDEKFGEFAHGHDHAGMKGEDDGERPELPYSVTVSTKDEGDFKQIPGAGVKIIGIEIAIAVNVGAEDASTLDKFVERAEGRLTTGREQFFASQRLLVYGILANEVETPNDVDLTRERTIKRQFVCVDCGGSQASENLPPAAPVPGDSGGGGSPSDGIIFDDPDGIAFIGKDIDGTVGVTVNPASMTVRNRPNLASLTVTVGHWAAWRIFNCPVLSTINLHSNVAMLEADADQILIDILNNVTDHAISPGSLTLHTGGTMPSSTGVAAYHSLINDFGWAISNDFGLD